MKKNIEVTPLYFDHVLDNDYQVVVQVGGRFSGKSHNEEIRLVSNLGSKEDYKLLVIEDLETGMSEGFHAGLYDRVRDFEHESAYTPESKVAHIRNTINGNTAQFRGYSTEQQKLNVKKLSGITEILVEEGEWMNYDDFMSLFQQLRGGRPEDRKLTILMNPVNPDCFVNEYLIETPPDKIIEYFKGTKRPKVFERHITTSFELDGKTVTQKIVVLVVLSTHYDNNFLTLEQRASIEQYKETDPDKYLQLGEARFIRPSGTYFSEFKREIHVVEPFVIPNTWTRYRALDYGLDMLACLWFAVSPSNEVYCYKELHEPELIISEAAARIKEVNGNDKIYHTYAPSDLNSRTKDSGVKISETFSKNGVHFRETSNKRAQGSLAVKEALKVVTKRNIHTGEPELTSNLRIFNNCTNLIKYLPQILKDEKDANCYAEKPHHLTHIIDALRYYCVTRYNKHIETTELSRREQEKQSQQATFEKSMLKWG